MFHPDVLERINHELSQAEKARSNKLEGRARVSARRAVGIALREFMKLRNIKLKNSNSYDLICMLRDSPYADPTLRKIASHLTIQVCEDFNLPIKVDLIAEARILIEALDDPQMILFNITE